MGQGQQRPKGLLRSTVPVAFGKRFMMPIVRCYLERWAEVEVDIDFNDDNRLVRKVLAPHRLITCAKPHYIQEHGMPEDLQPLNTITD